MKLKKLSSLCIALALTACGSEPVSTTNNALSSNINTTPAPAHCEPQQTNGEWVVPADCANQNVTYYHYEDDTHTTHIHPATATAVGVGAGIAGKMAYDKYQAKKANNKPVQTQAVVNPPVSNKSQGAKMAVPVKPVDLSTQTYKPATSKPSYTAPAPKRSYKSSYSSSSSKTKRK